MPTESDLSHAINELADEARRLPDPTAMPHPNATRRAMRALPVLAVLVVLAVAGVLALASRNSGAPPATQSGSPTSPSTPPDGCRPAITARVCARVLDYARQQANRSTSQPAADSTGWPASVTVVTIRHHVGTVNQPNIGPACVSGGLVTVDVIGTFDRVAVASPPIRSGQPTPDNTVTDIVITADSGSGRACLQSVRTRATGPARPPVGATIVYQKQ